MVLITWWMKSDYQTATKLDLWLKHEGGFNFECVIIKLFGDFGDQYFITGKGYLWNILFRNKMEFDVFW